MASYCQWAALTMLTLPDSDRRCLKQLFLHPVQPAALCKHLDVIAIEHAPWERCE